MNYLKISIFIAFAFLLLPQHSFARRGRIPIGEKQVLNKVFDFPDTADYQLDNGNYLDLATLHTEFNIGNFLPLYVTEEPRLVGFDEKNELYYDIDDAELDSILAENNITRDEVNSLPFFTRYGGKLIGLIIIGLIIYNYMPKTKEKVQPKTV